MFNPVSLNGFPTVPDTSEAYYQNFEEVNHAQSGTATVDQAAAIRLQPDILQNTYSNVTENLYMNEGVNQPAEFNCQQLNNSRSSNGRSNHTDNFINLTHVEAMFTNIEKQMDMHDYELSKLLLSFNSI